MSHAQKSKDNKPWFTKQCKNVQDVGGYLKVKNKLSKDKTTYNMQILKTKANNYKKKFRLNNQ